jgi:shikimate kinase
MNLRLKRTPGLYLVGFMGSGKTTVGRHLAHRLGWSFFDLDHEIEAAEKTTIAELFDTRGEPEFRRIESEMLRQHVRAVERGRPAVLALGGGAFVDAANRELIMQNGIAIWLDCPFDRVQRRVVDTAIRPLARDPRRFAALYESRRAVYALADVHIVIESDNVEDALDAVLSHPILK